MNKEFIDIGGTVVRLAHISVLSEFTEHYIEYDPMTRTEAYTEYYAEMKLVDGSSFELTIEERALVAKALGL